jgi:PAS domain S-box-containing protein
VDPGVGPVVVGPTTVHSTERLSGAQFRELVSQPGLLELIPDAFVGIGADGEIVLANAQTEALFGYRREQLIGQPVEMLIPERAAGGARSDRTGFLVHRGTRTMGGRELAGRRRDGSEFPAEISLSSVEIDGEVLATVTIRDISERIAVVRGKERVKAEVEQERLEAEVEKERLRAEVEQERLEAEVEKERLRAEVEQERLEAEVEKERLKVEVGTERQEAEVERERLKVEVGTERQEAEVERERLEVEVGTERLEAEVERERLLNELHHARRLESLGELAGGIAHDFNNLLAVIINYAAFVAEDVAVAAPVADEEKRHATRADVEQISLAAQRAAHLTHQLLAFARREVVQPEVVAVNAVVTNVEQLLKSTLGEHIELRSELAPGVRSVLIDPGRLEQILVNLAVNARDAMPDGGTLTIDTANVDVDEDYTAHRAELSPGPYVTLRVSDNGKGMTREVAERAFDPFFTTKPSGQGTGLGLATVYGIVQQAGGRVQLYSEPGMGTTASVLFPATEDTALLTAQQSGPAQLGGEATILLVEDEDALREVVRRILAGAGYRVITAANGEEALAAAAEQSEQIDLLLTDVVMPQMHGPDLAEQIKRVRPSIKVMFMSGFAQPILDSGGRLDTGVTLVEKPFSGPTLLAKVSQVLKRGAQET